MSQQIQYPEIIFRENIEWCRSWVPDSNVIELDKPRVLLIGDSIVMGYGPKVAEVMGESASIAYVGTSRFPADPAYLEEISLVLRHTRFDIIHFNNGLHGWDYDEPIYAKYLEQVLDTLRAQTPDAQWALATSTPVREKGNLGQLHERNGRVIERNESIRQLALNEAHPLTDLYELMKGRPEHYAEDGTHYELSGQQLQAEAVAETLRALIDI
ncbi:SGNH/GDSL hydrolase family protein [Puniceicoccus vermicola]|uniref:SGNH/GDSL hydrolase family protein n=1 Tax=Puniceicoccus vermicola TaxID=388746 RepID=A0A7X1AZH8_9BACT|nr:SGNH/GDSL hydrolase family protein [Puniceicoccus vermicola]MBC2602777.1 SGNH/GDSL hydrolase family protein [Puniceicoccus vermicola]